MYTTKVTHYNRKIKAIDASAKDVDELQADLCDFIVEIRKENGENDIRFEFIFGKGT